jgi:hypothetical protein
MPSKPVVKLIVPLGLDIGNVGDRGLEALLSSCRELCVKIMS